jgi:plastocyanin
MKGIAACLTAFLLMICAAAVQFPAQTTIVTGSVSVVRPATARDKGDNSNAVIWLKPITDASHRMTPRPSARPRFKIIQQHKRFEPHLLVIPAGSVVDFPNLDPFFHNVFSMFDGKRFDLGLYEAGGSHPVNFDSPGICYIFCNIHPEMSAVVVVVDTPYYATSAADGKFSIPNVPAGAYTVSVWHERGKPDADFTAHTVTISSENHSLGTIRLMDAGEIVTPHKNKYGRDYDPNATPNPVYK